MSTVAPKRDQWQWENAIAGSAAGFATVAVMHPLDVVRTRFQGSLSYSFRINQLFFPFQICPTFQAIF